MNELELHKIVGAKEYRVPLSPYVRPAEYVNYSASAGEIAMLYLVKPYDGTNVITIDTPEPMYTDWGDGSTPVLGGDGETNSISYTYAALSGYPETAEGYRQVVIRCYPATSGGSLSGIIFRKYYLLDFFVYDQYPNIVELDINAPDLTSIDFYFNNGRCRLGYLESLILQNHSLSGLSGLMDESTSMKSITVDVSGMTNLDGFLEYAYGIEDVTVLNTDSITSMDNTFRRCYNMRSFRYTGSLSAVKSMNSTFQHAYKIHKYPKFDTVNCTDFTDCFGNNYCMEEIPDIDTSSATTVFGMFGSCRMLTRGKYLDTSNVNYFGDMFTDCSGLQEVPEYDYSSCIDTSYMFNGCTNLRKTQSMNNVNTGNEWVNSLGMYSDCVSLRNITIPPSATNQITQADYMFAYCLLLEYIPALQFTNTSGQYYYIFNGCSSLKRCDAIIGNQTTFYGTFLTGDEINNIFNNLVDRTSITSATIDIRNTIGWQLEGYNTFLATDKNWTVIA